MATINECLVQLQKLTQKNLEILQGLNDSFFTNQNHLSINVGDTHYIIPSFISLENKINMLQENFNNLVHSPETGEANFILNGNSKAIELRKYEYSPSTINLIQNISHFTSDNNHILKDILTPIPEIKLDLSKVGLPNDITSVVIKKIIPKSEELKNFFKEILGSDSNYCQSYLYSDLFKKLQFKKKNEDYVEYDVIKKLPIRKNLGEGTYVIEKIVKDEITEDLENYITLQLRGDDNIKTSNPNIITNLTYKTNNNTISKYLSIGDELTTYDNSAKMVITEIYSNSNTIVVRVLNGEYLNLTESKPSAENMINDLSILKFFKSSNFNEDKYIKVPLEEDQYVYIAIAPLNDRMNIQSNWGAGLIFNVDGLILDSDEKIKFREYYDKNVNNIGDRLLEITTLMPNTIMKYSQEQFDEISSYVPELGQIPNYQSENKQLNYLEINVERINEHLNNEETVKNIRSLYAQKQQYNSDLSEVQKKINEVNKLLSEVSFDDTTNLRMLYTSQLTEYNQQKNEIVTSITKIINEIANSANNSEIPIDNAKYRIRGFYNYDKISNDLIKGHINGIRVHYRYKNINKKSGNASSGEDNTLFSDWNELPVKINPKIPSLNNNKWDFSLKKNTTNENVPSFNQIDIPISQGEVVDIKIQLIYDFGYPFIESTSSWSEITTVQFPEQFLKDINVLDIINENNNDIETNRFANIIKEQGIPNHINDKIIDQDIVYFHKPENIASGFYTNERRIIPLKDKLSEINNEIIRLKDEILNTENESLDVNISYGDITNKLFINQLNNISVEGYDNIINKSTNLQEKIIDGIYSIHDKVVSIVLNLVLLNKSGHSTKIYPLFPGSRSVTINENAKSSKYKKDDYSITDVNNYGVFMKLTTPDSENENQKLQGLNQFITFRINNPYDNTEYYSVSNESQISKNNVMSAKGIESFDENINGAVLYPILLNNFDLCLDNDSSYSYLLLNPGESISIPLLFEYKLADEKESIQKTMSFDIRTSLYKDPINYTFTISAKKESTPQDKILNTNRKFNNQVKYNSTIVK